ncbi:MAG: undecaprenyl-phosphate galactose phosphotransferase WbaP [Elusimicrobiota bacterium]
MNITSMKYRLSQLILLISDFIFLILILKLSIFLRLKIFTVFFILPPIMKSYYPLYFIIIPTYIIVFAYQKLYSKTFPYWEEVKTIMKSAVISLIIILSALFIFKLSQTYSRIVIITHTVLMIFLFPIIRTYIKKLLYKYDMLIRKAIIIGSGKTAEETYKSFTEDKNLCYKIAGFLDDTDKKEILGHKIHKGINKIEAYIKNAHITDVIIAKDDITCSETELINKIQHKTSNIILIPDIRGIGIYGSEIKYFFGKQLFGFEIKNNLSNPLTYITKRIIDYIFGLIIFVLISPLMVLISLIIKFSTEGPAIYSHKRIGKKGKEFKCYKFRTMYINADEKLKEILAKDPEKKKEWETYWKLKDDPRVTKIGSFLRKTSLDELPQIFNVLKGEMSLIGPRPYLPREWDYIKEESNIIHALPPGITGLWQVSGRNNEDYNFRITMDSWYVKNWNLWLDIVILLKTVKAVIKREGAC